MRMRTLTTERADACRQSRRRRVSALIGIAGMLVVSPVRLAQGLRALSAGIQAHARVTNVLMQHVRARNAIDNAMRCADNVYRLWGEER
jgi:hypothetical protein